MSEEHEEDDVLVPLPDELARGARDLRRVPLPSEVVTKAFDIIDGKERSPKEDARRRLSWIAALATVVPTASLVAVATLVFFEVESNEPEELHRFEEIAITIPTGGDAVADLDLWTHHHEGDALDELHVDYPRLVGLLLGEDDAAPYCDEARCSHQLRDQSANAALPLRLRVGEPGRYEIRVTHESREKRVSEHFVLRATRQ